MAADRHQSSYGRARPSRSSAVADSERVPFLCGRGSHRFRNDNGGRVDPSPLAIRKMPSVLAGHGERHHDRPLKLPESPAEIVAVPDDIRAVRLGRMIYMQQHHRIVLDGARVARRISENNLTGHPKIRMARGPDDHDDSWVSRLDGLLEALQGTIERVATHVTETLRSTDFPKNPRTNREGAGDQGRTTSTQRQDDRQSPIN